MDAGVNRQIFRFHDFELDLGAHRLSLRGEPVRMERRPLELLVLLVTRHGLLVPRDEIIRSLWPEKVVIDFDTGLNTLVRKVRQALGDSSDNPTYIETVAGLGYRFIAPIAPPPDAPPLQTIKSPGRQRPRWIRGTLWIVAILIISALAVEVWRSDIPESSNISIAVLPFENLSGDGRFDYLAAGLAEDTGASLAQIDLNHLNMIGHVSGQAYAASTKPIPQIGRELRVDFVVASSLRIEEPKIRVTSRLIRTTDNVQMWTASFDRELTSVLGLQRELSMAIAEQVRLRLSPDVAATIARRQTQNPQAYDSYLRGRYEWSQLTPAGSRRALSHLERAIEIDPGYALAWAGIAQVLSTAPITGDVEPAVIFDRARDAVQRALEFGGALSEVQYASGYFHFFLSWNWPEADAALRRAVALDPNNAIAHMMLGHVRSQMHNQVEAREMMRRARELDPLFSHTFALSSQIAFQARDYEAATEFARQSIAINPEGWVGHVQLGQVLSETGKYEEAIKAFDNGIRLSDGNTKAIAYRAYTLAKTGRREEARAVIEDLRRKERDRYVPPYAIAIIHTGLGEHDEAMEWLDRVCAVRDVHAVFLPVDPRWDERRRDPRFQALLDRCRFDGTLGPMQTWVAGDWTMEATVITGEGEVSGLVTFAGPEGQMRAMGMCLVQRYGLPPDVRSCNTVSDCDSAPADMPPGGSRYCVAPQNSGPKYCHYRPGEAGSYCVGTPALELARIAPGTYRVDIAAPAGTQWLAISCFEACIASPMSASESATVK